MSGRPTPSAAGSAEREGPLSTTVVFSLKVDGRRHFCTQSEAGLARVNVRGGNRRWVTHAGRHAQTRKCNCSIREGEALSSPRPRRWPRRPSCDGRQHHPGPLRPPREVGGADPTSPSKARGVNRASRPGVDSCRASSPAKSLFGCVISKACPVSAVSILGPKGL